MKKGRSYNTPIQLAVQR
ncbi:unnamed protein product, partial [Allacma fusca]